MESDRPLRHARHIFRVGLLLLVVVVVLILGGGFFVPDSWGEYGWYRGEAVEEHRSHTVLHGGQIFSKSMRGFREAYVTGMFEKEGILEEAIILVLPFVLLLIFERILPTFREEPKDIQELAS